MPKETAQRAHLGSKRSRARTNAWLRRWRSYGREESAGEAARAAYDGGDAPEPYGARGTAPRSGSGSALFDDYGRSIGSAADRGGRGGSAASPKVVRAVPKAETSEDVRGGVQKFRVKLLPEGAGSPMDVLCQVLCLF